MFTRLLLGSVLGMTLAFSPTTSVNAAGMNFGEMEYAANLLGFLEFDLLLAEQAHAPQLVVTVLQQDISSAESLLWCATLGHCNVSPF
jgi:hypothetical protein